MRDETFKTAKFLLIDDEPANVLVLENLLENWGCAHVHSTTHARDALSLYFSIRPDIVLLDLFMPELDGFDVMAQLKLAMQDGPGPPILVLTSDNSPSVKRRALAHGAKDFLTKPFDKEELLLRLRNLLETRFMNLELQDQNLILDEKVQKRTQELLEAERHTLGCLAAAGEYRDDDTGRHTQRVGEMAASLARWLGINEIQVELIRSTAPLHDVGKIGISDLILLKRGKLTTEEFAVMQQHTLVGHGILSRHHTPLLQMAANIAISHHERWDGGGYPHRLVADNIPIEGRIVAVADVFDALTHERPYKKAWPKEEAVAEIVKQGGKQFDPAVIKAFLSLRQGGG